ncbi:hypothetical protein [Nocardioides daeguensis]|uniref:Nuclear transport factor 2 family protein n=1 Tax=Nocardioides daeguensis TaxID=908359 RepID=A0ABP6UWB4_9ACTN|nr:hypothetical protein [Nocardioides daeguensis]MBV6728797.1 hypothetical protein [Nocardioides daeguensis]MCR1773593.1 hypothetical protein [Nocardioides daeguensis]
MTDIAYAKKWADTRLNDLAAHRALYAAAEEFAIEGRKVNDHLGDTVSTDAEFEQEIGMWGDGRQRITVTEAFAGNGHLMIHWDYTVDADTYRGLPTGGKTLSSKGSTFLQFDDAGKIVLESSFVNENPLFQQLGVPIITPHYWEEGFDPASLL